MKVIPKRSFLLRQDDDGNGHKKDVFTRRGEAIEVTGDEYKKFKRDFEVIEVKKK